MSGSGGRGHVAGLLAPYAEGFREELLGQGYTQGSAAHQIHLVAHLSCWLEAHGLEPTALDEVLPASLLLLAVLMVTLRAGSG